MNDFDYQINLFHIPQRKKAIYMVLLIYHQAQRQQVIPTKSWEKHKFMMEMEKPRHEDEKEDNGFDEVGTVLPGFRFHPTDQELVEFYLKRKVEKRPAKTDIIRIVDVYKYEPWDLPKVAGKVGEREWYFFCKRGRKYKNSIRPNRVTGSGFWKATGIDKPIYSLQQIHDCVGLKKSLVYYRGSAGKGTKTDWMMHEFRLPVTTKGSSTQEAEVWTLCRIFKREASYKKYVPDMKGSPPRQSYSDCSKRSYSGLFGDQSIEMKPTSDNLYDVSQLGIQVPFMASYLSFTSPSANENFVNSNWDELSPMVQVALDQSVVYSLR